jgi:hypothetical protein
MATFKINDQYSATYTVEQTASGWVAEGKLWKGDKHTKVKFKVTGNTRQAAVSKAHSEARSLVPD